MYLASKAFDRVEYCKLFRLLMNRKLHAVVLRMLCNMYVSHGTRVQWNGVCSAVFEVLNGVKQGGIISPILFCVYIDDLLLLSARSEVGCFIGKWFVSALAYADNIVLLALVLLRFLKFCCRSVSVGFCKKNRGFRFCLSRFLPVVNVVRLCGPLHIKPAAVRYIFLCITPVGSSKYPTACDWWRENHHLYPMSRVLRNATCLAVCATDIRC